MDANEEVTQVIPAETMAELVYGRVPTRTQERTMKTTIASMLISLTMFASAVAYAAPAKAPAAVPATMKDVAKCRDGKTYSNATGEHRGACSGHGGVASWADGTPVKARKAASYR